MQNQLKVKKLTKHIMRLLVFSSEVYQFSGTARKFNVDFIQTFNVLTESFDFHIDVKTQQQLSQGLHVEALCTKSSTDDIAK